MKIRFLKSVNEHSNTHYYANAHVWDKAPEVGDMLEGSEITEVREIDIDSENDWEIFQYNFYKVKTVYKYDEDDIVEDTDYIAVEIKHRFYVDYGTGTGNEYADTLKEAENLADKHCAYTQESIKIYSATNDTVDYDYVIAERTWWDTPFDPEETEETKEEVIQFGSFGYYGAWS